MAPTVVVLWGLLHFWILAQQSLTCHDRSPTRFVTLRTVIAGSQREGLRGDEIPFVLFDPFTSLQEIFHVRVSIV